MDIVYPLGTGSYVNNNELRFSLRSIERYLTGYSKVWIVGERPDWIQNVNHIPFPDEPLRPSDYNIMKKVTRAIEEKELSDQFMFFNDDHFLNSPFTANEFPYYYSTTLEEYTTIRGNDGYGRRAKGTLKHLQANNLPTKYFDVHAPIIYDKSLFLSSVTNAVDWNDRTGFIIKSMYANTLRIEGEKDLDNKVNSIPKSGLKLFSTMPRVKSCIFRYLQEQFPKQSKFEKTGICQNVNTK